MLAQKQLNQIVIANPCGRQPALSADTGSLYCGRRWGRRGFTLIELLVVISIIAILIGILLPALAKYRLQGYVTSATEEMNSVKTACLMYYSNYNAYPGPFSEADIANQSIKTSGGEVVTGTQNMLIGLMGTMYTTSPTSLPSGTAAVSVSGSTGVNAVNPVYVTNPLGSGPIDYSNGNVQQKSYLSPDNTLLLTSPPNGAASSTLPTLYDTFPDGLPILYYRKIPGLPGTTGVPVQLNASASPPGAFYLNSNYYYITNPSLIASSGAAYNEQQQVINGTSYTTALNNNTTYTGALAYEVTNPNGYPAQSPTATITNTSVPNAVGTPVLGGFVLISAGPDRIYGPPLAVDASQGSVGTLTWASAATSDDIIVGGGQ
ncbi:MAG: prepilin-type N-terminal cleavage/methylation domain-containing protein [Phycisphaerae bacterium]